MYEWMREMRGKMNSGSNERDDRESKEEHVREKQENEQNEGEKNQKRKDRSPIEEEDERVKKGKNEIDARTRREIFGKKKETGNDND